MSEHDFDGDDDIFSKSGRFGGNAEKRKDPAKPGGFGKSGNAGKPKDSTASSAGEGDAEAMRHLEHEFAAIDRESHRTVAVVFAAIAAVFAVDELLKYQQSDGTWEYRLLKNYQRSRLLVFLNPEGDLSGDGYNLAQAKIAIGSGGLFGKGIGNATQSTHGFLPEAPTDFIFCVLAEEFGFVGVMALIGLYALLIVACLSIARRADNLFGMLIVMGVIGMWLFQILENIGMDCGLMPITGIPLPFVSYGSSFMVVNFALIGLIGSVYSHTSTQSGFARTPSHGRKAS